MHGELITAAVVFLFSMSIFSGSAYAAAEQSVMGSWMEWLYLVWAFLAGLAVAHLRTRRYLRRLHQLREQMEKQTAVSRELSEQTMVLNREKAALKANLDAQMAEFGRLAMEDMLTGLSNGRAFDEGLTHYFSRSRRYGQPLCLMLINIDQLKQVNTNWSHEVGDKVLARVGKILRDVCRTADLPARLKDDKFAVILTDTPMDGGLRLSQRLHTAFSGISDWHEGETGPNYVSFSAGLVQFDEQQDQAPMHFLQRAERALYLAKSMGGGRTKQG